MYQPAEFSTTLAALASAAATSISVASATGLPVLGAGDMTVIRLDDGVGGAENVLCTAISGTTLTVAALAGAHAAGASVKGSIINIAALAQVRKDALAMGPEIAVTAATTATLGRMHRCAPTAAAITLTIPNGTVEGDMVSVRIDQAATKFVTLSSGVNIDGAATRLMWKGESAYLRWDSTNNTWVKVAGKTIPMVGSMGIGGTYNSTSGVATVALDTLFFDNTSAVVNTVSSRLDIRRAGIHQVDISVGFSNFSIACPRMGAILRKNSTTIDQTESPAYVAGANGSTFKSVKIQLAVGDFLDMQAFQLTGSTQTLSNSAATGSVTSLTVTEIPGW